MERSRGRYVALCLTGLAVVVVGVAAWRAWPHVQFWMRFESLGLNAHGLPEYRHRQTGIVFVELPGGTFWMGAQAMDPKGRNYDPEAEPNESPVHEVVLPPFLLAKFEVSRAEWERVMGPIRTAFHGTELPVSTVSWEDCQEFCRKTGLRLPTEAEWEYGCRAGTNAPYAGSGKLDEVGWYKENSGRGPSPVGRKAPNDFGLYDVHGNVSEWCEDVYGEEFYAHPNAAEKDPVCESGSGLYVFRGGSWHVFARLCRSAVRGMSLGSERGVDVGFRPSVSRDP